MSFLVNWFIALAILLAATLFLCLRAHKTGRERRIASARLLAQAIVGFWTAALIVVRGILHADAADATPAGVAAIALAALGLASVAAYRSERALQLRRPRPRFAR